jgi:hypothetical protein
VDLLLLRQLRFKIISSALSSVDSGREEAERTDLAAEIHATVVRTADTRATFGFGAAPSLSKIPEITKAFAALTPYVSDVGADVAIKLIAVSYLEFTRAG